MPPPMELVKQQDCLSLRPGFSPPPHADLGMGRAGEDDLIGRRYSEPFFPTRLHGRVLVKR